MIIREVRKNDLLDIYIWRNDKETIFFSKKKNNINLKNHSRWFKKTLCNPKIKFYMGCLIIKNKEKKVGVVRFEIRAKYALVSINLNPLMRGKKLSYILLSESIKKILQLKKINLIAEIKKNNLASINCFLKNKFYLLKSKNQYSFYQRSLG